MRFGDALNIPFEENRFDGVYCSHVIHVFAPSQAFTLLKELIRVVKPNGIIAITTVPMYSRLFCDSADVKPYPPMALRCMFLKPKMDGPAAPTLRGLPDLQEIGIWFRRPALFDLNFQRTTKTFGRCQIINQIQYFLFLRKYWSFNGYIIAFRNTK